MLYLAKQLNFTLEQKTKDQLFQDIREINDNDFLSEAECRLPQVQKLADTICDSYDIVLVGDINGDARFLLERIRKDPSSCKIQKMIILTTNRFDYHTRTVQGEDKMNHFHQLVRDVMAYQGPGPTLLWAANNPYEEKYASKKLGIPLHVMSAFIDLF